jgi:hypothetical protein
MKTRIGMRLIAVATVAIMAAFATGGVAAAPGTLDQQQMNTSWNEWAMDYTLAQTFTAGLTGQLDEISIHGHGVDMPEPAVVPHVIPYVTLKITNVEADVPGSTVLSSASVMIDGIDRWHFIGINPPVPVTAGTQYAIVLELQSPSATNQWNGTCTDLYAGGQALVYSDDTWMDFPTFVARYEADPGICALDFTFQTYVLTNASPPPTTIESSTAEHGGTPTVGLVAAALVGLVVGLVTVRRRLPFTS